MHWPELIDSRHGCGLGTRPKPGGTRSVRGCENWLMTNKSYDGHRYVALDQINTKNVGDLRDTCADVSHVAAPAQSAPLQR
jgi:hypothetical protein